MRARSAGCTVHTIHGFIRCALSIHYPVSLILAALLLPTEIVQMLRHRPGSARKLNLSYSVHKLPGYRFTRNNFGMEVEVHMPQRHWIMPADAPSCPGPTLLHLAMLSAATSLLASPAIWVHICRDGEPLPHNFSVANMYSVWVVYLQLEIQEEDNLIQTMLNLHGVPTKVACTEIRKATETSTRQWSLGKADLGLSTYAHFMLHLQWWDNNWWRWPSRNLWGKLNIGVTTISWRRSTSFTRGLAGAMAPSPMTSEFFLNTPATESRYGTPFTS